MSIKVTYPVKVRSYQVSADRDRVEIELEGVEQLLGTGDFNADLRRVGRVTFADPDRIRDKDFIDRGGFLQMDRPLVMFSGILDLLRNEKPLFLHGDGTLSTSSEPVGEAENG